MSDLDNLYKPRVDVATFNNVEPIKECVDVKPRVFNTYLIDDLGITKLRACKIGKAVESLWQEATALDFGNREAIVNMTVAELLDLYGKQEGAYCSFKKAQDYYNGVEVLND